MKNPFTFRCNLPKRREKRSDGRLLSLRTFGPGQNINVVIDDIARAFQKHLTGRLADAVDIGAIVYAADSAVTRGGGWIDGAIEPWARDFRFEIGVRDVAFWKRREVHDALIDILNFIADDRFSFSFFQLENDRAAQQYLNLVPASPREWPFQDPRRVLLFSGGLDSLAGAAEAAARGDKLVLVSHRAISLLDNRQQELYQRLRHQFPNAQMLRVPIWINKIGSDAREYTQRTRSFLFWALALAVGHSVNAEGMTFFENGIVSLNLPIADQVLRARASRTTHPITLEMLGRLSALVLERPFAVDNPYIYLTKKEVIDKIISAGAGDLIRSSRSCSRTRGGKAIGWHCGCCSQCIDRRIAAIASGRPELDPESDYATPVLTGARKDEIDRAIAVNYVRHAMELARSAPEDVAETFNAEISRAARPFDNPTEAGRQLIEMHLRHGADVRNVVAKGVATHTMELVEGTIEPTSLLGLVIERHHLTASWKRFADRITDILRKGVPAACASQLPAKEVRLQEICDGLLRGAGEKLNREFPYLRWASRMAKPDWSAPLLLVELKYIRTSTDIRRITEEIAADITIYGDDGRRTLFVVYDPHHHLIDEDNFVGSVERHAGSIARIIR
jgi:hypothetical protein